jgi:hypothetical protein
MLNMTRIVAVIIAAVIWTSQCIAEHPVQGKQNDQDRLDVVARILKRAYPDLADQPNGPAVLQVLFSNGSFGETFQLSLYLRPCRESGVSVKTSSLPDCGGAHPELRPVDQEKPFLRASVGFSQNQNQRTVVYFGAVFTSLDEKLQQIRDQFKNRLFTQIDLHDTKRYWVENDALQALQSKNPKFGPDHKKEFLALLPLKPLADLTSCNLHPESATFVVAVLKDQPPELKWHVEGDLAGPPSSETAGCSTTFEPFEGRLTSLSVGPKAD